MFFAKFCLYIGKNLYCLTSDNLEFLACQSGGAYLPMGRSTVLATVLDILADLPNFLYKKTLLCQLTINIPCQAELPSCGWAAPPQPTPTLQTW